MIEPTTIAIVGIYIVASVIRTRAFKAAMEDQRIGNAIRDNEIRQLKAKVEAIESAIRNTPFINYN